MKKLDCLKMILAVCLSFTVIISLSGCSPEEIVEQYIGSDIDLESLAESILSEYNNTPVKKKKNVIVKEKSPDSQNEQNIKEEENSSFSTDSNDNSTEYVFSDKENSDYEDYNIEYFLPDNFSELYQDAENQNNDINWTTEFVPIENNGFSGGNGTQSRPYIIKSSDELVLLSDKVNSGELNNNVYFALGDNIDMNGVKFNPIGNSKHHFSGGFDGRGYTVSNLRPELIFEDFGNNGEFICGFFGAIADAQIKNLKIENVNISYTYRSNYFTDIGLLSANIYPKNECKITNCKIAGTINIDTDVIVVGGLAGQIFANENAKTVFEQIEINAKLQVRGSGANIGGIVGIVAGRGTEIFSNICVKTEILHQAQHSNHVGAFGGAAKFQESISVKNCYFDINTNNNYDDSIHPIIGGIIECYQPKGKYIFENVFAFADTCDKLYEIPPEIPVSETNCGFTKVLPENCGFDTEIWDITDPSQPFIKTLK